MAFTYLRADSRWSGFTRVAPYLFLTIVINSVALLVISCLVALPLSQIPRKQFTFSVFDIALPILNILFSIMSIYLHQRNKASPSRMVVVSATFIVSWFSDFSLRTICHSEGDSNLQYCSYLATPTKSQQGLQIARNVLGFLCALAWVSLTSLSIAAAYRSKMDGNLRKLNGGGEEGSQRLFDQKEMLLESENEQ